MPSWETPSPGPGYSHDPWHVFLPESLSKDRADVRGSSRLSYPFPQRFAPYREGRWPTAEEFKPVELCDISSHGLALLLSERPTCSWYVVELGMGTNVSQVLVRVIQVTNVAAPFASDVETSCYRVGCEILPATGHDSQ